MTWTPESLRSALGLLVRRLVTRRNLAIVALFLVALFLAGTFGAYLLAGHAFDRHCDRSVDPALCGGGQ